MKHYAMSHMDTRMELSYVRRYARHMWAVDEHTDFSLHHRLYNAIDLHLRVESHALQTVISWQLISDAVQA